MNSLISEAREASLSRSSRIEEDTRNLLSGLPSSVSLDVASQYIYPVGNPPVTVALIDDHRFSRDCIQETLHAHKIGFKVLPFDSAEGFVAEQPEVELIIIHAHLSTTFDTKTTGGLALLRNVYSRTPIVILSEADDADAIGTYRTALEFGVNGLIPTRTTSTVLTVAAIHFVKAGGMFISKEMLLSNKPQPYTPLVQEQFTSRQVAVLSQMARGRANKIIAHELRMSESTVKVHIRNIMRKVGATNRTEAVYKSQNILAELGLSSNRGVGGDNG